MRGVLGSYFSLILILGILTVNISGSYLSVETCALIFTILPIIFIIAFLQMPESPYYLIMKERFEDAKKSLRYLRRKNNVEEEFLQLKDDVHRQMSEPGTYLDLFRIKSNRLSCVVMFGLRIIQQFSGITAFTMYMQTLFEQSTDVISVDFGSSLIFCLQVVATFVGSLIVDRVGRKPLLTWSCGGCFTVLVTQATYFLLLKHTTIDLENFKYLPLTGMIVFIIFFAIGLGHVVNLMVGEMFSSSIKAKASCLMNLIFAVTMLSSAKFFQYTLDAKLGLAVPFYVYAFCQLLGTIFCILIVPETTGKSLEQIQQELKGKKSKLES